MSTETGPSAPRLPPPAAPPARLARLSGPGGVPGHAGHGRRHEPLNLSGDLSRYVCACICRAVPGNYCHSSPVSPGGPVISLSWDVTARMDSSSPQLWPESQYSAQWSASWRAGF